jgi:hypothetical protein
LTELLVHQLTHSTEMLRGPVLVWPGEHRQEALRRAPAGGARAGSRRERQALRLPARWPRLRVSLLSWRSPWPSTSAPGGDRGSEDGARRQAGGTQACAEARTGLFWRSSGGPPGTRTSNLRIKSPLGGCRSESRNPSDLAFYVVKPRARASWHRSAGVGRRRWTGAA